MKQTSWLYILLAMLLLLSGCGGNPSGANISTPAGAPASAEAPASVGAPASEAMGPEEQMIEIEDPTVFPGDHDGERPTITMLAQSYENGNIIEIPQLTWATTAEETPAARAINAKILAFVDGYEEYVNGHPEEDTCSIETTAHAIGMEIVIVMQRSFSSSDGVDPEIAVFSYNWVLKYESGLEEIGQTELAQEEIINKITEYAAAQTALTITACELTAYAWFEYGGLFFYNMTVQNEEGETSTQTWAWLEELLLDEFDAIWRGADAFALLKQTYTDMPPDFDKVIG